MTLQEFQSTLLRVTEDVYHFEGFPEDKNRYIVWRETGIGTDFGSNAADSRINKIEIEAYTDQEFDPLIYDILDKLDACDEIAYSDPIITYDADVKLICYTVQCEVA